MKLKDLSQSQHRHAAKMLVESAMHARQEAVNENPAVLKGDFHAAAIMTHPSGDLYIATSKWYGPNPKDKVPAILLAASDAVSHGDTDIVLVAVYGGGPGETPRVHAPCKDCIGKILRLDADKSCDIVLEIDGALKLASLSELLDA